MCCGSLRRPARVGGGAGDAVRFLCGHRGGGGPLAHKGVRLKPFDGCQKRQQKPGSLVLTSPGGRGGPDIARGHWAAPLPRGHPISPTRQPLWASAWDALKPKRGFRLRCSAPLLPALFIWNIIDSRWRGVFLQPACLTAYLFSANFYKCSHTFLEKVWISCNVY